MDPCKPIKHSSLTSERRACIDSQAMVTSLPLKVLNEVAARFRLHTGCGGNTTRPSLLDGIGVLQQGEEGLPAPPKVAQTPDFEGVALNCDIFRGVQGCTGVTKRVQVSGCACIATENSLILNFQRSYIK